MHDNPVYGSRNRPCTGAAGLGHPHDCWYGIRQCYIGGCHVMAYCPIYRPRRSKGAAYAFGNIAATRAPVGLHAHVTGGSSKEEVQPSREYMMFS